jgi:ADP-ribosylation factor-binding protein GGA
LKDLAKKPNYKKKVEEELNKIESKAILMNEMLLQKSPEERFKTDATLDVISLNIIFL